MRPRVKTRRPWCSFGDRQPKQIPREPRPEALAAVPRQTFATTFFGSRMSHFGPGENVCNWRQADLKRRRSESGESVGT